MRQAGLDPAEVDIVIITHAHPDHVGGALDHGGRLNYPNARYYISKTEWDFWFSDPAHNAPPEHFYQIARKNLSAFKDQVTLTQGPTEITPGITLIPAPGHTPGHVVVEIVSKGQSLLYTADTALSPLHLEERDWAPVYDILPEQAYTSKQAIFDRAAQDHSLVIGQHFPPFPSLGYVTKLENGWRWQPKEDIL
jgi:glyoxylase-like metal-dependent hydrolase (beta-lactamase superfamily II)